MWSLSVIVPLIVAGSLAGLMAGLLGLGGGILVVPIIVTLLLHIHPDLDIQHIAVGTSFAIMVFTSLSSALTHAKLKTVDWPIFKQMVPGLVLGAVIGSSVAGFAPEIWLRVFFVVFIFVMSIFTFIKAFKDLPENDEDRVERGGVRHFGAGGVIGLISSWLGIGGGGITVPYLVFSGLRTHKCVGTAAAAGWPVAVAGAIGYIAMGMGKAGLTVANGFLGYVFLPGLVIVAICTVIFAPIGAKISTLIAPRALTITMAIAFFFIGVHMLYHLGH